MAVSSIEIIISKKPEIIKQMHDKMVTYKLLSFIEKADAKVGAKIMSVINKTLPTPTEQCSPTLKQYLNYIGDVLLNSSIKSDQ